MNVRPPAVRSRVIEPRPDFRIVVPSAGPSVIATPPETAKTRRSARRANIDSDGYHGSGEGATPESALVPSRVPSLTHNCAPAAKNTLPCRTPNPGVVGT